MVTLSNIGISVDKGAIPRIYKQPFMLSSISLSINKGTIPPKNYFKTKPVLKAFIFGSNARNEANENSDIDLLVELDYSEKIGLQFIQMKFDLEKLLNKSVDLVSSNGISKHIKSNIDKDKTLIYAR